MKKEEIYHIILIIKNKRGVDYLKMLDRMPSEISINTPRCVISSLTSSDIADVTLIYTDKATRK